MSFLADVRYNDILRGDNPSGVKFLDHNGAWSPPEQGTCRFKGCGVAFTTSSKSRKYCDHHMKPKNRRVSGG